MPNDKNIWISNKTSQFQIIWEFSLKFFSIHQKKTKKLNLQKISGTKINNNSKTYWFIRVMKKIATYIISKRLLAAYLKCSKPKLRNILLYTFWLIFPHWNHTEWEHLYKTIVCSIAYKINVDRELDIHTNSLPLYNIR